MAAAISPKVTKQMNENLVADVSEKEVRDAFFQMHPSKAPGPDGLSPIFFHNFWDVLGKDVVCAVIAFLFGQAPLEQLRCPNSKGEECE